VWGEVYAKMYLNGAPIVECYNVSNWGSGDILVRQWDGRNSGMNCYASTLEQLVSRIETLASVPFKRF